MPRIFISYRRQDAKYQARFIREAFVPEVGPEDVFLDVDCIFAGENFRKRLKAELDRCDVLLALIGPGWLRDPQTNQRRLDDPSDLVRFEIGEALRSERDIPVVPVLLDGAALPQAHQLPDDLKELCDRQAETVAWRTLNTDVKRLIEGLRLKPGPLKVFLPKWELTHLRNLNSEAPFRFKPLASFRRELEHLLFLNLIRRRSGRGFRTLFRDRNDAKNDAKLHFKITESGRSYLRDHDGAT